MPIAVRQTVTKSGSPDTSHALTFAPTLARSVLLIFIATRDYSTPGTVGTFADDQGNAYNIIDTTSDTGEKYHCIATGHAAGGVTSATWATSISYGSYAVGYELVGAMPTYHQIVKSSGSGTSYTSPALTPKLGSMLFGFASWYNNPTDPPESASFSGATMSGEVDTFVSNQNSQPAIGASYGTVESSASTTFSVSGGPNNYRGGFLLNWQPAWAVKTRFNNYQFAKCAEDGMWMGERIR